MFPDLPEHLQTLNAIPGNTPPSTGMNQEQEEAFWGFLHADELFRNFGSAPSPADHRRDEADKLKHAAALHAPAPTPAAAPTPSSVSSRDDGKAAPGGPTLESFLAAYIGQSGAASAPAHPHPHSHAHHQQHAVLPVHHAPPPTPSLAHNYLLSLPAPYGAGPGTAPSAAPTPIGVPSDVMPSSASAFESSPEDARPSGAKKLKSMGAPAVEIEEDKRRRNTEASARFRAKKKEREQALEHRAKELEAQVAALAAENTSLENENRLLKAIVLNGSGASATAAVAAAASAGHDTTGDALQAALASLGKRKREE
ncbi:hypothetical protein IAT38_003923 [Cryptococcus sp. DSM 104549]